MRGSWLSGRKHRSTKPTNVQAFPGFESLAARHNNKYAGAIQLERYAGLQNQCASSASSNLATCAKHVSVVERLGNGLQIRTMQVQILSLTPNAGIV